jgi:hypothetical protein
MGPMLPELFGLIIELAEADLSAKQDNAIGQDLS